nr:hypothetical protein [Tanacetum cinerariifolium]
MCRRLVWPLLSTMLVSQMHLHWVEPEKMRRVSVWASRLQEKILKAIAQAHQTEWCSNDSGGVKKDVIHPNEAVYLKEVSDYLRLLWVYKGKSPSKFSFACIMYYLRCLE